MEDSTFKCSITHEHTETKFLLDLTERDGCVDMIYEHRLGEKRIT